MFGASNVLMGTEGNVLCTTAYVTGDRTASILVTWSTGLQNTTSTGPLSNLVDGGFGNNNTDSVYFKPSPFAVAGEWMQFDFITPTLVTEAKWYLPSSWNLATWKWQGANVVGTWFDIGNSFTFGNGTTQTQTELNANKIKYRYYRMLGVSGNTAGSPWMQEVEFKQCS